MTPDPRDAATEHTDPDSPWFIACGLTDIWMVPGDEASSRVESPPPKEQWEGFYSARGRFLALLAQQARDRRLRAAQGEF